MGWVIAVRRSESGRRRIVLNKTPGWKVKRPRVIIVMTKEKKATARMERSRQRIVLARVVYEREMLTPLYEKHKLQYAIKGGIKRLL